MNAEDLNLPDDLGLALAIARRVVEWLKDERARTGLTDEEIAAKYDVTFDATDAEQAAFLARLGG